MRHCKHLIIVLLLSFPLLLTAQSAAVDITGLWTGTLYNDTTGRTLRYEIAISEEKGKLSAFTHTFFIIDDKQYHGVKRSRVKKQDGKIIIETIELIANNYPIPPPKGVKQIDKLTLEIQDSIMVLSGPFVTTRTKDYHPLTGSIRVQRKNDYRQSALIPHLEELGLKQSLSFVEKEEPEPTVVLTRTKNEKETIVKTTSTKNTNATIAEKQTPTNIEPKEPAADVNNRAIETVQSVYYKSDSLVLTLYDNGEIDGDTVSVLLNGTVIIPKQGLSTRAFRKTIYTKEMDSIQLVMYAESLGSIPPNTGLLVVNDGNDIYEIRFSGDYKKNAAILFRRKK